MGFIADLVARIRSLVTRDGEAREHAEEIRYHIELEIRKNLAAGMSPREAKRAAHRAFGGVERWTDAWREARGVGPLERALRDVRLTVRRLAREPGLTFPALLTLGFGVCATSAVFALTYAILLRPLPYPDADRLVEVGHMTPATGGTPVGQSTGTYAHYREGSRSFSEIALYYENDVSVSLTDGDAPEHVRVAMVTPSFFPVLGIPPEAGRWFDGDDIIRGPADPRTPIMISHDLWVRRYGADPHVVDGVIELNLTSRRVVGVMPEGFAFPHTRTDVWYVTGEQGDRADLANLDHAAVARLRPDVGIAAAETDLARLLRGLPDVYADVTADDLRGVRPVVRPLRASLVQGVRHPLELLALSTLLVLVATVANVTALFLVRAERRRGELGVSRALGAGEADLVRRFLSEGLVLSMVGGTLGGLAAQFAVEAHFGFAETALPRLHEIDFGPVTWAFAMGVALLAGLTVAGGSLLRARDVLATSAGMGATGRSAIGGWRRVHSGLAVLQVALSLALLVTSSVMIETLVRVLRVDPGFDPAGTVAFALHTPFSRYPRYIEAAAFYREARAQLGALPGVRGAEAAARLPLTPAPDYLHEPVRPTDAPGNTEPVTAAINIVTPGWFRLMDIRLLGGEPFGDLRSATDAPPVVVSAGLARDLFGEAEAVGRTVRLPGLPARYPSYTVAGVVSDVPSESLSEAFEHTLYVPALLDSDAVPEFEGLYPYVPRAMIVAVRGGQLRDVVSGARRIVGALDPTIPVANVRSLEGIVADATARRRLVTLLSALAAAAALGLGVTGVYGIVAYSVSQRTAEMGVRMALGSTAPQVERVVLAQTVRIAVTGVAVGLGAAFMITHALRGQLFEVTPTDPTAYAASVVLVLLVVLAAGWIPARRAGRLDVVAALNLR